MNHIKPWHCLIPEVIVVIAVETPAPVSVPLWQSCLPYLCRVLLSSLQRAQSILNTCVISLLSFRLNSSIFYQKCKPVFIYHSTFAQFQNQLRARRIGWTIYKGLHAAWTAFESYRDVTEIKKTTHKAIIVYASLTNRPVLMQRRGQPTNPGG